MGSFSAKLRHEAQLKRLEVPHDKLFGPKWLLVEHLVGGSGGFLIFMSLTGYRWGYKMALVVGKQIYIVVTLRNIWIKAYLSISMD